MAKKKSKYVTRKYAEQTARDKVKRAVSRERNSASNEIARQSAAVFLEGTREAFRRLADVALCPPWRSDDELREYCLMKLKEKYPFWDRDTRMVMWGENPS